MIILLIALVASCSSERDNYISNTEVDVEIIFGAEESPLTPMDTTIESLLLVLYKDGEQFHTHQATLSEIYARKIDFTIAQGIYDIYLWANLSTSETNEILAARNTTLLSEIYTDLDSTSTTTFRMCGSANNCTVSNEGVLEFPVILKRIIARIHLHEITTSFQSSGNLQTLLIDSIYFIDIAGKSSLGGDENYIVDPQSWYSRCIGFSHHAPYQLFNYALPINSYLPYSKYYSEGTTFDLFANSSSSQITRMVITGTLSTKRTYYTIDLWPLQRNECHNLWVEITGMGTDCPSEVEVGATFEFVASDWGSVVSENVYY